MVMLKSTHFRFAPSLNPGHKPYLIASPTNTYVETGLSTSFCFRNAQTKFKNLALRAPLS